MTRRLMTLAAAAAILCWVSVASSPGQSPAGEASGQSQPPDPTGTWGAQIPLKVYSIRTEIRSTNVEEAIRHFQDRLRALGGPGPVGAGQAEAPFRIEVVEEARGGPLAALSGFQREEGYLLKLESPEQLKVCVAASQGAVHGISDLETRLRARGGEARLAFPEWKEGQPLCLREKPAMASRGEYLNIGYDLPGITPHRWDLARWRAYIDGLVLARLNRWYFFLWIDTQSVFPGSRYSKRAENHSLHEGVREAIRHAHRRGLKVTFMISPTMLPQDLWEAHPEWKADIEYARHGFACVCPNAPGAWEQMLAVWRTEMEWFREADAVQVWFYDPGGCWCEKHGCKAHQAESLARQVREFGSLFRQGNPGADIEYNLWPLSLWEAEMKVKVRENLSQRLKAAFESELGDLTAVGTPEGSPAPVPDFERSLGMRGSVFLFPTNPETGYVFPTPLLHYLRRSAQTVQRLALDGAFGHRLEAGTRYAGTFLMGQWLWEPELEADRAVRRFADWQTASEDAGARFAEALGTLDELTYQGIQPEGGRKLEALLSTLLSGLPAACRDQLEYWPAVGSALRAIGESATTTDQELEAHANRFRQALGQSKAFAPLTPQASELFRRYRTVLLKGWEKEHF